MLMLLTMTLFAGVPSAGGEQHSAEPETASLIKQVESLAGRLARTETLVQQYSREAREAEAKLIELRVEHEFRIANMEKHRIDAGRFSDSCHYCNNGTIATAVSIAERAAKRIRERLQRLKAMHDPDHSIYKRAEIAAETSCEHASEASSLLMTQADTVQKWIREDRDGLNELADAMNRFKGEMQSLYAASSVFPQDGEKLKAYRLHVKACQLAAEAIDECHKDKMRIDTIERRAKALMLGLGQTGQWLRESLATLQDELVPLANRAEGNELGAETAARVQTMKERLRGMRQDLSRWEAGSVLSGGIAFEPPPPCSAADPGPLDSLLEALESALSEKRVVLAEAEGALLLLDEAVQQLPAAEEQIRRGRACHEKLVQAAGTVSAADLLENAATEAETMLEKSGLVQAQGGQDLCEKADTLRAETAARVERIEKAESLVRSTLEAAQRLADKCPDVENPANIKTLYNKAEGLTVDIGADVVLIIRDRDRITEYLELAARAHQDAVEKSESILQKITALHDSMAPLAAGLSEADAGYGCWEHLRYVLEKAELEAFAIRNSRLCSVEKPQKLAARAERAYAGALAELGGHEGLVALAQTCSKPEEAEPSIEEQAMAAIDACDFAAAKTIMDTMPEGEKKSELVSAYDAGKKLEVELKVMVNQKAKGKYRQCDYDGALKILQKALAKATCQIHIEKINKSIAATQKGKALEDELKVMVNEQAKGMYQQCNYDGALEILNAALAKAKCEVHKTKINKSIGATKKGQKLEAELRSMVKNAGAKYDLCLFDEARSIVDNALAKAKCEKHIKSLNGKKGKIKAREQKEQEIHNNIQTALNKNQQGASAKALDMLNNLLPDARCEASRVRINNAIAQIKADSENRVDGNSEVIKEHTMHADNFTCTVKAYLSPPSPDNSLICWKILTEDVNSSYRVIHALKYSIGHPETRRLRPRGGFTNFLCMDFGEDASDAKALAEAKENCQRWFASNQGPRNEVHDNCEIKKYRDKENPNRAGSILEEEKGDRLILHVTNNREQCAPLASSIYGRDQRSSWGQTVSGSHRMCEGVVGRTFNETARAAKQKCEKWNR